MSALFDRETDGLNGVEEYENDCSCHSPYTSSYDRIWTNALTIKHKREQRLVLVGSGGPAPHSNTCVAFSFNLSHICI